MKFRMQLAKASFTPVELPADISFLVGDCAISQWDGANGVYLLKAFDGNFVLPGSAVLSRSAVQLLSGDVVVDCRRENVEILAVAGREQFAILEFRIGAIVPRFPESLFSYMELADPPEASFSPPEWTDIVESDDIQPWLAKRVRELFDTGSRFAVAVGVGLLARLASPQRPATLDERAQPRIRAARWFAGLDAALRKEVEDGSVFQAKRMRQALPSLARELAANPDGTGRTDARMWLHVRDDLASLAVLASRGTPYGDRLASLLGALDRDAEAHRSMWSLVADLADDERLSAVSRHEPEAWWGNVAISSSP